MNPVATKTRIMRSTSVEGEYILLVNSVLEHLEGLDDMIDTFEELFSIASFPYKIDLGKGKRHAVFTDIPVELATALEPYLITSMVDSVLPTIAITSFGIENIVDVLSSKVQISDDVIGTNEEAKNSFAELVTAIAVIGDGTIVGIDSRVSEAEKHNTISRLKDMSNSVVEDDTFVKKINEMISIVEKSIIPIVNKYDKINHLPEFTTEEEDDILEPMASTIKASEILSDEEKIALLKGMHDIDTMEKLEALPSIVGITAEKAIAAYMQIHDEYNC